MGNAYDYIYENNLNTDKDYPYHGKNMKCNKDLMGKGQFSIKGCKYVKMGVENLTEALK